MNGKWYRMIGEHADTVISTRIRLARNLSSFPFPRFLNDEQRMKLVDCVKEAAAYISGLELRFVDLATVSERDRLAMVERHIVSRELAAQKQGALLVSEDETVSIMINEEDHLRIQVMKPGMALKEAYDVADLIDTALDERLYFAFDERLGYLTQCPTNLGTGMRASLMLHLPALQERGLVQSLTGSVSKLGLTVRGAFGEGTRPMGAMYQMSNQVTLGISETSAIENLSGIAQQIMEREREARRELCAHDVYEDRIWRSYGLLRSARLITKEEAVNALSDVRMGVYTNVLPEVASETVSALMLEVQPGCLMSEVGEDMAPDVRDRRRADRIRTALGSL